MRLINVAAVPRHTVFALYFVKGASGMVLAGYRIACPK
jgi:hypothetical protein